MKNTLLIPLYLLLFILSASSYGIKPNMDSDLKNIKNFTMISERLGSAGMPSEDEISVIKKKGYKHIISLLPGDQSEEQGQVNALKLTFDQIPVDWRNPKLEDFEKFVSLMDEYGSDKVFVHCAMNYRASAFSYLYQVTQKIESHETAETKLHLMWEPTGEWLDFINKVKRHYK